ncbi:hypothetical protein JCM19992_13450 [Thermostilla marina]
MPEPIEHTKHRNWIETILRYIPGFRGYLEKEYRRDSDELQRQWLADRLQRSKRAMDNVGGLLAEAGLIDVLPRIDRIRSQVDHLIARIRGAMQGYSGFFDLVRVDEALLDKLYDFDVRLIGVVDDLAGTIETLADRQEGVESVLPQIEQKIENLQDLWDERDDLLQGLG